jgi:hypothetical protein
MRLIVVATLVAATAATGCTRKQCDAGVKSRLELRDASGATTLSWKGNDFCDGQLRRIAGVDLTGGKVTLKEPNGRVRLELSQESPATIVGKDPEGPHLRAIRQPKEVRVQRGDGVPYGFVVPEGKRDAVIYTPGSMPIGRVTLRDSDAVVTDMSGSAQTYVVPSQDPALAGVFGIPKLDPAEQLAIYIFWSR